MGDAQHCPVCTAHVKNGAYGGPPKGNSGVPPSALAIIVMIRRDHRSSGSGLPSRYSSLWQKMSQNRGSSGPTSVMTFSPSGQSPSCRSPCGCNKSFNFMRCSLAALVTGAIYQRTLVQERGIDPSSVASKAMPLSVQPYVPVDCPHTPPLADVTGMSIRMPITSADPIRSYSGALAT